MKLSILVSNDVGLPVGHFTMELPKGTTHFTVKPHGKNVSHDPVSFDFPRPTVKKWKWECRNNANGNILWETREPHTQEAIDKAYSFGSSFITKIPGSEIEVPE